MNVFQLEDPITIQGDFGLITLTHEAWGIQSNPLSEPRCIRSIHVLGALTASGEFIAYPKSRDEFSIQGAQYEQLIAPSASGKKGGEFRTDDVRKAHLSAYAGRDIPRGAL